MIRGLAKLLDKAFRDEAPEALGARKHAVQVATALLLIEVARADYAQDLTEDQTVFALIRQFFQLSDEETALLVEEATRQADHASSLQTFTRRLNEDLSAEEKLSVVEMLWRVALADSKLDKHEDYLVRKVADLLYVPHGDLIRIRNRVRG